MIARIRMGFRMGGMIYDYGFDERQGLPRRDRHFLWAIRLLGVGLLLVASVLRAQMPNAPVLQDVWTTPGAVLALNLAGGSQGSVYGAAASFSPGTRLELSGGVGLQAVTGAGSRLAYGFRGALPLGGATSAMGFGLFAGVGGGVAPRSHSSTVSGVPDTTASASVMEVPVGGSVGWRHDLGNGHGFSLYGSPLYMFVSGGGKSSGLFRAAVGADAGITPVLGATVGVEFGQTRTATLPGPRSTLWGLGVSYALGRR